MGEGRPPGKEVNREVELHAARMRALEKIVAASGVSLAKLLAMSRERIATIAVKALGRAPDPAQLDMMLREAREAQPNPPTKP